MNVLEIKGLKKIYRIKSKNKKEVIELKALDGVDLTVKSGEYISIIGPSGSGKSTLMQIMGLLDNATEGTIEFLGKDITKLSDNEISDLRRNYIGFVFQFFNLLSKTTALDNVNLPLIYSRKTEPNKASNLLDMVGLSHRKDHMPNQLSGGQQQRVAIARALINDPKIIFADEPTGNISQAQSEEVMGYFSKLNALGVTIVLITHDPKVAKHAKRIITVKDGKIESDVKNLDFKEININDQEDKKDDISSGSVVIDSKERGVGRFRWFLKIFLSVLNFSFLKENVSVAYKALASNKFRTFLSMFGIMIGIASVVTMVSLGEGTKQEIKRQYEEMGTNRLQVTKNWSIRSHNINDFITAKDYEMIKVLKKEYPIDDISRVEVPDGTETIVASYLDKNYTFSDTSNLSFTDPSVFYIFNLKFKLGSTFTEQQEKDKEKVCVIGSTIYKNLFKEGENPIGKKIYISRSAEWMKTPVRSLFTVIGVLDVSGNDTWGNDKGEIIIIPYSTAIYRFNVPAKMNTNIITAIQVKVKGVENIGYIKNVLTQKLAERRGIKNIESIPEKQRSFWINDTEQMKEARTKADRTLSTLLIIIACISLFVGGIGIMNIMIVSVKERTREIGLRKALGARKIDIMFQFITEATMIGLIGGCIGIILGVIISSIISIWIAAALSWSMVGIAFAFSFTVALVFGYIPAKSASELSPVEALRYE